MSIKDLYNKYFPSLIIEANNKNSFTNTITLKYRLNDHYISFNYDGFTYSFVCSSERARGAYGQNFVGFAVELYFDKEYFDSYFEQMKVYKNLIQQEIDTPISWQELELTSSKKVCRIYARLDGNIEDTSRWDNYIQWQLETMKKFISVLPKFTKKLSKVTLEGLKMTAEERENAYKKYLLNAMETSSPASSYPKMLTRDIPNKLQNTGENTYNNLFECTDINYLENLRKRLLQHGDLHQFNIDTQANSPSTAINHYIKFLKNFSSKLLDEVNIQSNKHVKVFETQLNTIKNILLCGVPGVGKTHNTKKLIGLVEQGKSDQEIFETISKNEPFIHTAMSEDLTSRVKFITFHQSFGYEDFIEGFRPNDKGAIELQEGIFKIICEEASNNRDENYYLVIDEINRGNISKIFGELITLIEEDKRDTLEAILPYSKQAFSIPSNLFIIGTMNSTDKSIALIDIALRRRFTFVKMKPNYDLINHLKSKTLLASINEKITEKLGEDYQIGHSYFMKIKNDNNLSFVIEYKIKPLLEEYFYGDTDGLSDIISLLES